MDLIRQTTLLIKKEIVLEWRSRYAISGILLYVLSTVFVVYISFVNISPRVLNVIFWIIVLFASVNAVAKSFVQESGTRQLYYYSLADPLAVLLAKMIYNSGLLFLLCLLTGLALIFVAGNPVEKIWPLVWSILLGSLGLSSALTFISAIATKAKNSSTLLAVLSFPVVLPILMTLIKLSAKGLGLIPAGAFRTEIYILSGIILIFIAFTLVLFPYLWRE